MHRRNLPRNGECKECHIHHGQREGDPDYANEQLSLEKGLPLLESSAAGCEALWYSGSAFTISNSQSVRPNKKILVVPVTQPTLISATTLMFL